MSGLKTEQQGGEEKQKSAALRTDRTELPFVKTIALYRKRQFVHRAREAFEEGRGSVEAPGRHPGRKGPLPYPRATKAARAAP